MFTHAFKSLNLSGLQRRDPLLARRFFSFWKGKPETTRVETHKVLPNSGSSSDSKRLHLERPSNLVSENEQSKSKDTKDTCDPFVLHVAKQLETFCQKNAAREIAPVTVFHLEKKPSTTLENFLKSIDKCEVVFEERVVTSPILISALIYMARYLKRSGSFLNDHNVHQLLGISLRIAMDIHIDDDQTNPKIFSALVAGIDWKTYLSLERNFYKTIDFDTIISPSTYEKWESALRLEELERVFEEEPIKAPKEKPLKNTWGYIKYDEFWLDTFKLDAKAKPTDSKLFKTIAIPTELDDKYDLETSKESSSPSSPSASEASPTPSPNFIAYL